MYFFERENTDCVQAKVLEFEESRTESFDSILPFNSHAKEIITVRRHRHQYLTQKY